MYANLPEFIANNRKIIKQKLNSYAKTATYFILDAVA